MSASKKLLRRHWLTGALVCGVVGLMAYTGGNLYRAEQRLRQVRLARAEVEARLQEEQRINQTLTARLTKVTSDAYMEVLAKEMGFIYPHETVYQKSTGKGL